MSYFKIVLFLFLGSLSNGLSGRTYDPGFGTSVSSSTKIDHSDYLSKTDFNILFVGNSLTYTNDLPKLVKEEAKARGIIISTTTLAKPNHALIDHWNDGLVQEYIRKHSYDFVIVQQGPSSQAFGREVLIEYGEKIAALCSANGAKLGYFMVWPSLTYYQTFEGVIKNYGDAAAINDAIILPVGSAWKKHFDATNSFAYYSGDGFHPTLSGSKKAAEIIVDTLFR